MFVELRQSDGIVFVELKQSDGVVFVELRQSDGIVFVELRQSDGVVFVEPNVLIYPGRWSENVVSDATTAVLFTRI